MNKKQKFDTPELSVEELSKALYEVNLQLQESNNKLQEEQRKKTEFYANISHDLRAPITAISNSVQYLLSGQDIEKSEAIETLQIVNKRVEYLQKMINDIFLLSSLDSSEQKVHKEKVDVSFFLEDFYYMCEADERFEKAKLELSIAEDLEATLMMDPYLMQMALDNLFTNALKYGGNQPEIKLEAYMENDTIVIKVCDTGIGISEENLKHIFERSYQVEKARTPEAGNGSGFGLSIVKSIVEHHGGSIDCESKIGVGSKFIIKLPK